MLRGSREVEGSCMRVQGPLQHCGGFAEAPNLYHGVHCSRESNTNTGRQATPGAPGHRGSITGQGGGQSQSVIVEIDCLEAVVWSQAAGSTQYLLHQPRSCAASALNERVRAAEGEWLCKLHWSCDRASSWASCWPLHLHDRQGHAGQSENGH